MYSDDFADALINTNDAFGDALGVATTLAENEPEKAALIAEADALRRDAQELLNAAKAAFANGDEALARTLLKQSVEKTTAAALKLAEALE